MNAVPISLTAYVIVEKPCLSDISVKVIHFIYQLQQKLLRCINHVKTFPVNKIPKIIDVQDICSFVYVLMYKCLMGSL